MKKKPIIFSGPMVRAILAGKKTVTRRIIKPQPIGWLSINYSTNPPTCYDDRARPIQMPYAVGERLWVKEKLEAAHKLPTHFWPRLLTDSEQYVLNNGVASLYDADGEFAHSPNGEPISWQWKRLELPSMYMPKWASRITLEVVSIQPARLQDMTTDDARLEGVETLAEFRALWDSLNAERGYPWDSNPWVWVVEFKRIANETRN